jgi:hypothetical protein
MSEIDLSALEARIEQCADLVCAALDHITAELKQMRECRKIIRSSILSCAMAKTEAAIDGHPDRP